MPNTQRQHFKISPPATNCESGQWSVTTLSDVNEAVSTKEFHVIFAADDQLAAEEEKRIAESGSADKQGFEIKRKSDKIIVAGNEVVLQCDSGDLDTRLSLLQDFLRLNAQASDLEERIEQLLKDAKQDAVFTGKVDQSKLPEFERLSLKNRIATVARIEYLEIVRQVAKAKEAAEDEKLFSELMHESGLSEKIERLDDEIEACEEVYSVCIDRLSEFSYFWREYLAELWIIVILVLELASFFVDLALQIKTL